jgi:hypothetical protein
MEKMFSLLDGAGRSDDIAIVPCLPLAYDKQFDGSLSRRQLVFGGLLILAATFLVMAYEERKRNEAALQERRRHGKGERVSSERRCSDYSDALYCRRADRLAFAAAPG